MRDGRTHTIKEGYTFGYMDPTYEAAQEYPDVHFFHCSGYKTYKNMTAYFGRIYQPRFLSGLVAGMMTKTNIIGYVAAHPIPEGFCSWGKDDESRGKGEGSMDELMVRSSY